MSESFFESRHQYRSTQKRFGLCDDLPPPHKPACLDETDGRKWIATDENDSRLTVLFVALDNSIALKKDDGAQDNCCDGLLSYNSTVIFVELKQRSDNKWIKEGDLQLRSTIQHFESTAEARIYQTKVAYIANKNRPRFRTSQNERMNRFFQETNYILRIENRIRI